MKALNLSPHDSADYRRSWEYWANIHGYYGSQSPDGTLAEHLQLISSADQIYYQGINDQTPPDSTAVAVWATCQHSNAIQANFFAWHRMYLYYFEQVLRWAANDNTLRLPYWDYTNPTQTALPAEFRDPNSVLFDTRSNPPLNSGSMSLDPTMTNIDSLLGQPAYFTFELAIEEGIHGYVHCTTGPGCPVAHMGDVPVAANDPIFYEHHANIDRMWACWQNTHANPLGGWQNQPFKFVDAQGNEQTKTVSEFLDSTTLGYVYENYQNCLRVVPPHPQRIALPQHPVTPNEAGAITLLGSAKNVHLLESRTNVDIPLAPGNTLRDFSLNRRTQLTLHQVSAKKPPGVTFIVYVATAERPTARELVGTISWFGVFGHHGSEGRARDLLFDITDIVQKLKLATTSKLIVTFEATSGLVPSNSKDTPRMIAASEAVIRPEADVQISSIEMKQIPEPSVID